MNGEAGGFQDASRGFAEWSLDSGIDQSFLEFVGEGSFWQLQRFVERMNAWFSLATVGHAVNVDLAEYGFESPPLQSAMSKQGDGVVLRNAEGGTNIAGTAKVHMGLQQKALDLAAFENLLLFDEMERRGLSSGRSEPLFEVVKSAVGICHIITVVLP